MLTREARGAARTHLRNAAQLSGGLLTRKTVRRRRRIWLWARRWTRRRPQAFGCRSVGEPSAKTKRRTHVAQRRRSCNNAGRGKGHFCHAGADGLRPERERGARWRTEHRDVVRGR